MALAEAQKGADVRQFREALGLLHKTGQRRDSDTAMDQAWIEKRQKQAAAETARLEHELKGYKNNLIKESIRVRHPHRRPDPFCFVLSLDAR